MTGAGGPGAAEIAIRVEEAEEAVEAARGTSGAAELSPDCERSASRGADAGLICSFGFAGPASEVVILSAAVCCSRLDISGVGVAAVATRLAVLGRSLASVFSLISMRGRAGACDAASWTTLGISGRNLGASCGAEGLINVCRGCVGRTGSV